jgi:hypothetical protein
VYWRTADGEWRSTNAELPAILYPYRSYSKGNITITPHIVTTTNYTTLYKYVTNSTGSTLTNTVGFFPNATYQYPDAIRAAVAGSGLGFANDLPHIIFWAAPSNSFMTTGDWDGLFATPPIGYNAASTYGDSRPLYSDWATWTNWVALSTLHRSVTTNYTDANGLHSTTNYPYTLQVNCGAGDAIVPIHTFAFERDANKLYWSTNAYNDMARALSLMQWQGFANAVSCKAWRMHIAIWLAAAGTTVTYTVTDTTTPPAYPTSPGYEYAVFDMHHFGEEGDPDHSVTVTLDWNFTRVTVTNRQQYFQTTNTYAWCSLITNLATNAEAVLMPERLSTLLAQDTRWRLNTDEVNMPPLGSVSFLLSSTETDGEALVNSLASSMTNYAMALANNAFLNAAYNSTIDSSFSTNDLPAWYWDTVCPSYYLWFRPFGSTKVYASTYRIIFQSLTNYLNHAPAR